MSGLFVLSPYPGGGVLTPLPSSRLAEALGRMPYGWISEVFLPGVDAALSAPMLCSAGKSGLSSMLSIAADVRPRLGRAGFPFSLACDDAEMVAAVVDALLCEAEIAAAGGGDLPLPGVAWEEAAACVDATARDGLRGAPMDALDGLLVAPDVDIRARVGLAPPAARARFSAALARCGGSWNVFSDSYLRRSTVACLVACAGGEPMDPAHAAVCLLPSEIPHRCAGVPPGRALVLFSRRGHASWTTVPVEDADRFWPYRLAQVPDVRDELALLAMAETAAVLAAPAHDAVEDAASLVWT